jgi:inosose dehydratase
MTSMTGGAPTSVTDSDISFGVDLITFFDPRFWGFESFAEVTEKATVEPRWFWDRVLDSLESAGIDQLELTFAPADAATAIRAYGSADAVRAELQRRGLVVLSAYFGDLEKSEDPTNAEESARILAAAAAATDLVAALGGRYLVLGLPMRRNTDDNADYLPVDAVYAAPIADILNRIGAITAERGIDTALHTESHSVFWHPADVELFLGLTDPATVSLCLDTAHVVLGGGDPVALADQHSDRLRLAHWKDAAGPVLEHIIVDENVFSADATYFRPLGEGVVDWAAWCILLQRIGLNDCVLLELDAAADPVTNLIAARTHLLPLLAPQRTA